VDAFLSEQASRGAAESTIKAFRRFLCGSPGRDGYTLGQTSRRKALRGQFVPRTNVETFSKTLVQFMGDKGVEYIEEVKPEHVLKSREGWNLSQISYSKQTERLKQFFRFCVAMKWIEDSPAAELKPPITAGGQDEVPVIPFTKEQVKAIVAACPSEYLKTF